MWQMPMLWKYLENSNREYDEHCLVLAICNMRNRHCQITPTW